MVNDRVKDAAGNMLSVVSESPASGGTVVTQTRTVNDLNQITQNSINTVTISPPANTTVNANYTYDASGNRETMTVSGNTTTYTWDDDNRLTQVVLPGNVTIQYSYDVLGRMLSRTDSNGTATFVWDHFDVVQETDYQGNVTRYCTLNGWLMSFDRQGTVYQVHSDALGSVRKVTDPTGTVVATYDYDAWGNQLSSTSDSIPDGGLQYRFVGSYGVRWDAATGLYFMRQRWYDSGLGRFLSRDPLGLPDHPLNSISGINDTPRNPLISFGSNNTAGSGSYLASMVEVSPATLILANLYGYAENSPASATDSSGLSCAFIAVTALFTIGFVMMMSADFSETDSTGAGGQTISCTCPSRTWFPWGSKLKGVQPMFSGPAGARVCTCQCQYENGVTKNSGPCHKSNTMSCNPPPQNPQQVCTS